MSAPIGRPSLCMIAVIGGENVGKSCLIEHIISGFEDRHQEDEAFIFDLSIFNVDDQAVLLEILQFPNSNKDREALKNGIRLIQGVMLVYDITSRESFEKMPQMLKSIQRIHKKAYFPTLLVATKCDAKNDRQVSREEGEAAAKSFDCGFIETSAWSGENAERAFHDIVREFIPTRVTDLHMKHRLSTNRTSGLRPSEPMDMKHPLPFFAPESQLPAPLPPPEAIEASTEILEEYTGRRVIRFSEFYVIKYGLNVSLTEGENMLLVHETQPAFVPEVFALYSIKNVEGRNVNYIIMANVIGDRMDTIWTRLIQSEKIKIATQLRAHLDSLRSLSTPGYFGCIGRRPFEESMFWTNPEDSIDDGVISGPFDSESKLNNALVQKYVYNSGLEHKAAYYRRVLPLVLHDHKSVFTHGDFQRKNMLLKKDGSMVLIDWEAAGWYPEYWEYALAMFACGSWKDDWHEYLGHILDEYPNEYAWFDMLRRELWS